MFLPTIFGFTSTDLLGFASAIVSLTAAFLFLYFLDLPLKELPWFKDVATYEPPQKLLPIFALGSLAVFSFFLFSSALATWLPLGPDKAAVLQRFSRTRTLTPSPSRIASASFTIDDYGAATNFELTVNGYRVFGSQSNCFFKYQCAHGAAGKADALNPHLSELKQLFSSLTEESKKNGETGFGSIYHALELSQTPLTTEITPLLVEGNNYIDIFSGNSGEGHSCSFGLTLRIKYEDKSESSYMLITRDMPDTDILDVSPLKAKEEFPWQGASFLNGSSSTIIPYGTYRGYHLYRTCERIHIPFFLLKNQLISDSDFFTWAQRREAYGVCSLLFFQLPKCPPLPSYLRADAKK